jgi:hypothetical protein
MSSPLNGSSTARRGQGEAGKIAAKHETSRGRVEALNRYPEGNKSAKESIGKLDDACRNYDGSDLNSPQFA